MRFDRRQLLLKSLQLFDLMVLGAALLAGAVAHSGGVDLDLAQALGLRLKVSNFLLVVAFLGMSHVTLRAYGLYESRRLSKRTAEVRDIVAAVTWCTLVLAGTALLFKIELFVSRSFLMTFWVGSTGALILSRAALRSALAGIRRSGRNLRHVLIVGTNRRAAQVAMNVERRPELGYRLVGFADNSWQGQRSALALGYPIRTDLAHLAQFLRESVIDEVFICLPLKSYYECIRDIIETCENQGIIVRLPGRLFDLRRAHAMAETFEDEAVVSVYSGRMEGWPIVAKRTLDVVGALILLAAVAPILALAAVAIKVASPGPVFFVQERVGISKRRFRLLKFRTMVSDAETRQNRLEAANEATGPVFKIHNDPRITSIGRILRKTSIDELPQLLNVLKGDMSLVGPRPLPVRDYNGFDQDWHRRRFSVRPGITCLWQVNGRSHLQFDRWMELDMEYIDRWSLWLDLKILMKTVPAVLKGSGAA